MSPEQKIIEAAKRFREATLATDKCPEIMLSSGNHEEAARIMQEWLDAKERLMEACGLETSMTWLEKNCKNTAPPAQPQLFGADPAHLDEQKDEDEGWHQCECEYCSLQGEPECAFADSVKLKKELMVAIHQSPCMYNDQGDVEMLRSFVRRYNTWVKEVRNPTIEGCRDEWLKVVEALSDLHALRSVQKNLVPFDSVDLYNGEKVTIGIKRLDGSTEELDGDWLVRAAIALEE